MGWNAPCGTCDAPAKATFLNIKTFAGFFSCPKCLIVGEKSDESDDVMVFPHEESLELRTRVNYDKHLEEVMASTVDSVAGIKGPTILDSMLTYFMFDSTSIDSLHCLYIGITKQIFRLLFDKTFKGEPFSLHQFTDKVNSRLLALHLPHFVQRVTLPVDKLYLWKGTLCRNVFFHMMLPVLNGIMADNYFRNIVDLVDGVSILNSDSISVEDITYAGLVLSRFCANFQQLYGKRHMSSNLHLLRHLHECVSDLGPLFFSSTFTFEDLNGKLANLAHGTRHAGLQIAKHLNLFSDLDLKVSELPEGLPKSFCEKISKKSRLCISEKISENMFIVGNYDNAPNAFCDCIGNRLSVVFGEPCNFSTFSRAFYNKQLFVTSSYTRGSRVSSFIKCNDSGHVFLAEILSFVRVNMAFSQDVLVLLREIQVESFSVRHMKKVVGFAEPKLVALHDLVSVCFKILVDDCIYVSEPLNTFEME
ncbi:Glutamate-1-semialdehyde 2,1-aminomutase [Frankliniella fusca]|uniref:Glutamate-1-semialdehyde 2,1-aminomutase n=1 Tax=Frankliniella fusca TaxID=407009 RepID=A0AAE1GWI2_9NEOP|nr:Glutamate-1-semialdehyde 2,1-aminomutase [Frankliniella fusca]